MYAFVQVHRNQIDSFIEIRSDRGNLRLLIIDQIYIKYQCVMS